MKRSVASTVVAATLLAGGLAVGTGTASAAESSDTGSAVVENVVNAPVGSVDLGSDVLDLAIANPGKTIMTLLTGGFIAGVNAGSWDFPGEG